MTAHEALGALFSEFGWPADAFKAFEASLRTSAQPAAKPGRRRARAAAVAGDKENARSYFLKVLALADGTLRPEIAESKTYVSGR